jgi:hypothetical protein
VAAWTSASAASPLVRAAFGLSALAFLPIVRAMCKKNLAPLTNEKKSQAQNLLQPFPNAAKSPLNRRGEPVTFVKRAAHAQGHWRNIQQLIGGHFFA